MLLSKLASKYGDGHETQWLMENVCRPCGQPRRKRRRNGYKLGRLGRWNRPRTRQLRNWRERGERRRESVLWAIEGLLFEVVGKRAKPRRRRVKGGRVGRSAFGALGWASVGAPSG